MHFDGAHADVQLIGDELVGQAGYHQIHHIALAFGEVVQATLQAAALAQLFQVSVRLRPRLLDAIDGDWVESLTALSEEADGTLCLLSHTGQILADVAPRLRLVPQDVPRAA